LRNKPQKQSKRAPDDSKPETEAGPSPPTRVVYVEKHKKIQNYFKKFSKALDKIHLYGIIYT
jgi:hypothetical protein